MTKQQLSHLINPESEAQLLGALLINPTSLAMCEATLQGDDFGLLKHQYIYEAMLTLWGQGLDIDVATVSSRLQERGLYDAIGGRNALIAIMNDVATSAHAETYAELVQRLAIRRKGIATADEIKRALSDLNLETYDAVNTAHEKWLNVTTRATTSRTAHVRDIMDGVYETFVKRMDDPSHEQGVMSRFDRLDQYLGGFESGRLYITAGRPGAGKSLWVSNLVLFMANEGVPLYVAVSEMTKEQFIYRLCAILIGQVKSLKRPVTTQLIRRPHLMSRDEQTLVSRAMAKIADLPIIIDATPSPRPSMIESAIIKHRRKDGVQVAIVDGIYHMKPDGNHNNRIDTVASITRDLSAMALRWELPIIATHQLNRDSDGRRPTLANLKDTSVLEEEASAVFLLHREAYYNDQIPNDRLEVIVAKNRDGDTGAFMLGYDAPSLRVYNLKEEHFDLTDL